MSGIVLSASVRQNLLSLQSTSQLLATTQNDLATGNKVNSALDNPTNYFTAQSLNSRASDISNLLDGIGNGVQVLQAANTGITSLKSLLDSAKSIANQALQASSGYSQKSQFSTTIAGATANNLLGTSANATAGTLAEGNFSTVDVSGTGALASAASISAAFTGPLNVGGTASTLAGTGTFSSLDLSGTNAIGFSLSFDGGTTTQAISIDSAAITAAGGTPATATEGNVITALNTAINTAFGTTGVTYAADNAGAIDITSGTAGTSAQTVISGYTETGTLGGTSSLADGSATAGTSAKALTFGVKADAATSPTTVTIDQDAVNTYNQANSTTLDASSLTGADVANLINAQLGGSNIAAFSGGALTFTSTTQGAGSKLTISGTGVTGGATNNTGIADHAEVDGTAAGTNASLSFGISLDGAVSPTTVTISAASLTAYNADTANASSLISDTSATLSGADVAKLINYQVGSNVAAFANGKLSFTSTTTGAASNVTVTAPTAAGGATDTTGIAAGTNTGTAAVTGLSGETLTIGATAGGTATNITFGSAAGQISTLNDLNTQLAKNNLMATIDSHGLLTISTTNNNSSATVGDVGGTATDTGNLFASSVGVQTGPVADAGSQETRAGLVSQYNEIMDQIKTTAQDSSFNGVNLLNGDLLQLTFNETGSSTLNIQGNTDDPSGLGLSSLASGTDFLDNTGTNKIISSIENASNLLDSQASTLGSNLSIVQIRQTFSTGLINVLQTGASNLTLADPNELAADSQALSTRQSIAVSALALANQSQQSVLQLLQG